MNELDYLGMVATLILVLMLIVVVILSIMHDDVKDIRRNKQNNHPSNWLLEKQFRELKPGETVDVTRREDGE